MILTIFGRYEEMFKHLHSEGGSDVPICSSDLGGIYYGIGVFNLILSILPKRVVKLVQFLGFQVNNPPQPSRNHLLRD